ncbi:sigma factor-binding protein Crl [Salinivibrio kushneri]|uniref:sigma factor-binding protein Crl n=1 Tax=Salinivibrio kushneri TaxID=1908198 RepID=UPI0009894760|nr:sigma factor-binding protein Crl [Salinivibrio kushneri]OOE71112.1 sigma factor-binding protein Crl [Salinivibrio kushneri]WBA12328.1 sigma factor-binding protein Crl [Salinivibrio kushneri]
MSEQLPLSYGRLKTRFTALGPYFREGKSDTERYFFDSLSVCVDAKKDPDAREFWGWWLELTPHSEGFEYRYGFGLYDKKGDWVAKSIPREAQEAVDKTLTHFYDKLCALLEDELNLALSPSQALTEPELACSE